MFRIRKAQGYIVHFRCSGTSLEKIAMDVKLHDEHCGQLVQTYKTKPEAEAAMLRLRMEYESLDSDNLIRVWFAHFGGTVLYATELGHQRIVAAGNFSLGFSQRWYVPEPSFVNNEYVYKLDWTVHDEFLDYLRKLYRPEDGEFIVPQ